MFIRIWVRKGLNCSDYSFFFLSISSLLWAKPARANLFPSMSSLKLFLVLPYALRDSPLWSKSLDLPGPQFLFRLVKREILAADCGVKEEKEVRVFIPHFFLVLLQFCVVCSPLWPQPLSYFPLTLFIIRDQAQRFLLLTFQAEGCYGSLLL